MTEPKKKLKLSKKTRTLAILNDFTLSTAAKVDKLLALQQEGRRFKDYGPRVPGSRKEISAIRLVCKHEDAEYMRNLSKEFDKHALNEETKKEMLLNAEKTYKYEVGVQRLINKGDELRKGGYHQGAVKEYLSALRLAREYRQLHHKECGDLWLQKVLFMAYSGMGIANVKLDKPIQVVKNFQAAIENAPDEQSRSAAESNLKKYKSAYKEKTVKKII